MNSLYTCELYTYNEFIYKYIMNLYINIYIYISVVSGLNSLLCFVQYCDKFCAKKRKKLHS